MTPPAEPGYNPSDPSADPSANRGGPLTRSRSDRMLAGVAGGIAQKFDFDPAYVRLAFVAVTILSFGTASIAYLVAWLVVPEADADEPVLTSAVHRASRRPFDRRLWIGVVLVFVGANAFADQYGFHVGVFSRVFWPMVLIGAGAAILLLRDRREPPRGPSSGPGAGPRSGGGDPAPPTAPDGPSVSTVPPSPVGPSGAIVPDDLPPPPPSAYPPSLPWPEPSRPRLPRARRERSVLGPFTWSALLIIAGGAWLIDLTGAATVNPAVVVAIELGVVGVALLVGAWFGRSRGLIAVGLILTLFAGPLSAIDVPLRGDIGENIVRPASIAELGGHYRLAIGHLELDLDDTRLDGKARKVVLTDAIGFIEVFVPANARVEVDARSDVGAVRILGRPEIGGTHAHIDVVDDPPGTSGPRILIDAHVGFGAIKVTRTGDTSS